MAPDPDETEVIARGRGGRILAAVATTACGGANLGLGGAHLHGVLAQALDGRGAGGAAFAYDFRFASLILIGAWLVVPGAMCLWRAIGLARGRRAAWAGALRATLVLVGVNGLLVPVQGFAVLLGSVAAANLVALILLRRHYRTVAAAAAAPEPSAEPLADQA